MSVFVEYNKYTRKTVGVQHEVDWADPITRNLIFACDFNTGGAARSLVNLDDNLTCGDNGVLAGVQSEAARYAHGGPRGEVYLQCAPQRNVVNAPWANYSSPPSRLQPSLTISMHWVGWITGDMPGADQNNPAIVNWSEGLYFARKTNNTGNIGNKDIYYISSPSSIFNSVPVGTGAIGTYGVYASATMCVKSGSQLHYWNGVQVASDTKAGAIQYSGAINLNSNTNHETTNPNYYALYVWSRFLTVGEIKRLHQQPYAPLRARTKNYFFLPIVPATSAITEAVSDTLTLSDSTVDWIGIPNALADDQSGNWADSTQDTVGIVQPISDSVNLTDTIVGTTGIVQSTTDSIALTDLIGSGPGYAFSDTVVLSDLIGTSQGSGISDTLNLLDNQSILGQGLIQVGDTFSILDSINLFLPLGYSFTDTLTLGENLIILLNLLISFNDTLSLNDSIAFGNVVKYILRDNILLTDFPKYFLASNIFSDQVILQDNLSMFLTIALGAQDSLTLSDNLSVNLSQLANRSVSDSIILSDAITVSLLQSITSYIRRYLNDVLGN